MYEARSLGRAHGLSSHQVPGHSQARSSQMQAPCTVRTFHPKVIFFSEDRGEVQTSISKSQFQYVFLSKRDWIENFAHRVNQAMVLSYRRDDV